MALPKTLFAGYPCNFGFFWSLETTLYMFRFPLKVMPVRLRLKCKLGIQEISDLNHAFQPSRPIDFDDASFIWYVAVDQNGSKSPNLFYFLMDWSAEMLFLQSDSFVTIIIIR